MPRPLRPLLVGSLVAILYSVTLFAAYTPLTQRTLSAEVVVNTPAVVVWQILTGLDEYRTWNPFFQQISGVVAVGQRLRLEAQAGTDILIFTPTVLEARRNRELRWLGRMILPGIFDGEHSFTLTHQGENRVRLV